MFGILSSRATPFILALSLFASGAVGQDTHSSVGTSTTATSTQPSKSPLTPQELFRSASPAVVKLIVRDSDKREIGIASGFVIGCEQPESPVMRHHEPFIWRIVTNYHVIYPAVSLDVRLDDGTVASAQEVLAEDDTTDLAVISIVATHKPRSVLALADATAPIGSKVYTIGSPRGMDNSLSDGLVSGYRACGRHLPWVQITAPISPGSSGGPLLSPDGLVLGVTTASLADAQNLNFAVPAQEVTRLLERNASSRPVWKGASIQETITRAAEDALLDFAMRYTTENLSVGDHEPKQSPQAFLESQIRSGDSLAMIVRAYGLRSEGNTPEATAMFRGAAALAPDRHTYLASFEVGVASQQIGLPLTANDKPFEFLSQAKELNSEFGPTYFYLTQCYVWREEYPEALLAADSLVRLMPRCYEGYQLRGEAWAQFGRLEKFEDDFKTACLLRPVDPLLLGRMADGYSKLNATDSAIQTYRRAIRLDPNSLGLHTNFGVVLKQTGRYADAVVEFRAALDHVGDFEAARRMIEEHMAECRTRLQRSP